MYSSIIKENPNDKKRIDINLGSMEYMQYTGLKVFQLKPSDVVEETVKSDREVCIVIVSGYIDLLLNEQLYENLGNRETPFVEEAPYAVYVTAGDSYSIKVVKDAEIAICYSIGEKTYPSRVIEPQTMLVEHRGYGQIQRTAKNILPETEDADSLLVVEVITKGGNWSSFPSHRHDEDDLPNQTFLEEIYYHKLNPNEGGFVFQRIYDDSGEVNDAYVVKNNNCVLVKKGYHPVSVPPGYDCYYLNVMAGPKRKWKFYNDPYFEKLLK